MVGRPRCRTNPYQRFLGGGVVAADGNRRAGFIVAGSLLLILGTGVGMLANLALHSIAPAQGLSLGLFTVYPGWSWYATVVFVLGAFATLVGLGMLWLSGFSPSGPVHLPDTEGPAAAPPAPPASH